MSNSKITKKKVKTKNSNVQYIFNKEDYNNNNGMLTSVWGPSLWHTLHCISVNYPVQPTTEDKKHYKNFINSLRYVLPCKYCRSNLTTNLQKVPLNADALKNRENFSKWMYILHEKVNKNLGKRNNLQFRDIQDRYEHFRARCYHTQSGGSTNKHKNEKGCVEPIYGVKSKCQLHIVPQEQKGASLLINKKCIGKRV